jgi:hypothetical protein
MRNTRTTKAGKPKCILERCNGSVLFVDETQTGWCNMHWRKYDMMKAGELLGYPPLLHIPAGQENWLQFVLHASNQTCNEAWREIPVEVKPEISRHRNTIEREHTLSKGLPFERKVLGRMLHLIQKESTE